MSECKNIVMTGSNLVFYMNQNKVTVEELAEGTGISIKAIYRYRAGERIPGLLNACSISRYLNVRLELIWCVFDKK